MVYSKVIRGLGVIELHPIEIEKHLAVIYDWVTKPYAKYWGMNDKPIAFVREEYERIPALIGLFNGQVSFLCEIYDPAQDPVGEHYEVQRGDLGMHLLVGPPVKRIPHFTLHVFATIMDYMFSDPAIKRIVVEPDINNTKIHTLNKLAGFEYQYNITFPHKIASLAFCTREQYLKNINNMKIPAQGVAHLKPALWAKANRLHVCKIISEFSHELMLHPELQSEENGWGIYHLTPPGNSRTTYSFKAKKLSLNHWYIDKNSINKSEGDLDSMLFILEFKDVLGISAEQLPGYLEEIANTLYGSTYMMSKGNPSAKELAQADYQTFEHAMTSGHPCFVANNGRIGFDTADYREFAPEADQPIRLIWLAGHKSHTAYSAVDELPYATFINKELDEDTLAAFNKVLKDKELNSADYFFIPVHPWQWYNKLSMTCAPDIAANNLVCLGYGPDEFMAQQSIRTFYNVSHPEKFYTKTALSVLNMGFVRGLTPYYMDSTPPITDWIKKDIGEDPYLKQLGFTLLCEVATVGYRNFYFEQFGRNSAYNKMLAALWRESPASVLQPGQQLMTMAALLHVDDNGDALLPALISASGKTTTFWLKQYLRCYLTPLLHCFYQHDLVFMPHGENLILVMEGQIPVKVIMKDITEEIAVFNPDLNIHEKAKRICVDVPEELRLLSIFIDVFDCFFRFLTQILVEHTDFSDQQFWELVAKCITEYQQDQPQLSEKFEQYDMFAPSFTLSCLNRLQLANHKQMVDLADPAGSLQLAGTLDNPVAAYKPVQL
jgi:siderophore synthetase component